MPEKIKKIYLTGIAEIPEIKNKISHRAKALEKLKENIDKILK